MQKTVWESIKGKYLKTPLFIIIVFYIWISTPYGKDFISFSLLQEYVFYSALRWETPIFQITWFEFNFLRIIGRV